MNKKLLVLLVAACAIFATGIFAACSSSETLGGKYTTDYHRVFTDECDDFMTIDGKLDEEVWTNKKYVTNAFPVPGLVNDVSLKYTVHATEKGLYIGSTVNDTDFRCVRPFSKSDSNWKVYVAPDGATVNNQAYVKSFQIDYAGVRSAQAAKVSSAVSVDGEVNSGNTRGASMEVFVTWEQLNIDCSGYEQGYPDKIRAYVTYTIVSGSSRESSRVISSAFTGAAKPSMYYLFGAEGYVNADRDDAILGDAPNGFAKTSGWDLSGDGFVESVGDNVQTLWFRNAYSERFAAEVKIKPVGNINDSGAKVGMIAYVDTNRFRSFLLNAADGNLTADGGARNFDRCQTFGLTYYPYYTWTMQAFGVDTSVDMDAYPDGCVMRIVKDGENAYYFINDTFVYGEKCPYLDGKTYVGLTSVGFDAVFTDYEFRDYSADEAGLIAELDGVARLSVKNGSGGYAEIDDIAIKSGGSAEIRFNVWQGYTIASVEANGEDITETVRASVAGDKKYLTDGVCTIWNVLDDTEFTVNYAPIAEKRTVKILLANGKNEPVSGKAIIYGDDPLLRYEVSVGESGTICALPAGVGLKALLTTDGEGTLIASIEENEDEYTFVLGEPAIGGDYTYDGGFGVASARTGWDYTFQSEGTVYADETANATCAYFGGHYDDTAVVKVTINKSVSAEQWAFAGIVMANPSVRVETGIQAQKLRYYRGGVYTDVKNVFTNTLFGTEKRSVTFALVRSGGKIRVYETVNGQEKLAYEADDLIAGKAAYGLTVRGNNDLDIEFTNITVLTGNAASDEIARNYTPGLFGESAGVAIDENAKTVKAPAISSGYAYADFAGADDGDKAVVSFTVNYAAKSWAVIGFTMSDGTNKAYIGMYATRLRTELNGSGNVKENSGVFKADTRNGLSDVKLMMIRSGNGIAILEYLDGQWTKKTTLAFTDLFKAEVYSDGMFTGEVTYGVGVRATSGEVVFSDIDYKTGSEAQAIIDKHLSDNYTD